MFPRVAREGLEAAPVSERGRSDPFIALDEASLAVEVLPLLRKQLVIDRVSARGVRAVVHARRRAASAISTICSNADDKPATATGTGRPPARA